LHGFQFLEVSNQKKKEAPAEEKERRADPYHVEWEVLHEQTPRVLYMKNFLTHKECDTLVALAMPTFVRSQVAAANGATQQNSKVDNVRTSSGAWISREDKAVDALTGRVSYISNLPRNHGEAIQILQYQIGQEYKPHYDYFDPAVYSAAYLENGGQRMASCLTFLSDVEEGGETTFPVPGIDVKPLKGAAVMWWNTYTNGTLDPTSAHGGKPVIKGTKYAAVQWMRQSIVR